MYTVNVAALYRPGAPVQTYLKKRMVPGYEADYVRGTDELVTHSVACPPVSRCARTWISHRTCACTAGATPD